MYKCWKKLCALFANKIGVNIVAKIAHKRGRANERWKMVK